MWGWGAGRLGQAPHPHSSQGRFHPTTRGHQHPPQLQPVPPPRGEIDALGAAAVELSTDRPWCGSSQPRSHVQPRTFSPQP